MSASGSNILRYSALLGGLFYGVYHQQSIRSTQAVQAEQRKYQHEISLIEKAKQEYKNKQNPSGVISDPDHPKFDLEAYLKSIKE